MAAPNQTPARDKLDESSVSTNLQSILDRIDRNFEANPRAERYQRTEGNNEPLFHPEVDRADYFMGIVNFDPTYCPKGLFPRGMPEPMQLLHSYMYSTGNEDQLYHKIRIAPTPGIADAFKRHWKARATTIMELWKSVDEKMTILEGTDASIFSPDNLAKMFVSQPWDDAMGRLVADIVQRSDHEGPARPIPHPIPIDVPQWVLAMGKKAVMPKVNRPDLDCFSELHQYTRFYHQKMPKALGPIHEKYAIPMTFWSGRIPIPMSFEDEERCRCRTRTLEQYIDFWAPMLNLENLSKPGNFVSMLYNRAKHHPATYASRDFETTYIARAGRMDDIFNYHYLPSFWEVSEDDIYITHVDAPADGDTFNKAVVSSIQAKSRLYTHLEIGAILHTQEILYEFIDRTLTHIGTMVHEARSASLVNVTGSSASAERVDIDKVIRELNEDDLRKVQKRDGNGDNRNELVHRWAIRQYAPPTDTLFDFDECEINLLGMREQARDRLRELMTDPMAFLNEAKNIIDHHPGQVKSIRGEYDQSTDFDFSEESGRQVTRHFDKDKIKTYGKAEAARLEDELLSSVLHTMVLAAVRELEIWDHLYIVAQRLGDHIRTEHIDLHDPETPLEGELRKLWLLLLHSLRANHRHLYIDFQHNNSYLCSPKMRIFIGRHSKVKKEAMVDERIFRWEQPVPIFVNSKETRDYRVKELKKHKRGPDGDWKYDDSILYGPDDEVLTRFIMAFDDDYSSDTDDSKISRTFFFNFLKGEFLSCAGMSNLCEHVSRLDAKLDPKDRRMTPYVWRQIQDLVTLSRMVDDMERTRRVLPPQAQRLRQEFEEDWGDLSGHVFGPSKYLPELSSRMFIPDRLRSNCKPLRGLLYPLLKSIDKGLPHDDQGCLVPYKDGWDREMPPQNRHKELAFVWKHALSGIVGGSIEEVFEGNTNAKVNRGIKGLTTGINKGTFGAGLARFLSTFETGGKRKDREVQKERQAAQEAMESEEEIAALKQIILRRSDALERATRRADGDWAADTGDPMDVDMEEGEEEEERPPLTAEEALAADEEHRRRAEEEQARQIALRPVERVRGRKTNYRRNRRRQLERQAGGLQNLLAAPAPPPIVRQPLAQDHWDCFRACFGRNDAQITTNFIALRQALGAINYSVRPSNGGSGWRFSWTPESNLPPAPGATSMGAHEPHGAALRHLRQTMLRIGARLPTIGVTPRRLARYYEGAPDPW
jgi:hypothetical protein